MTQIIALAVAQRCDVDSGRKSTENQDPDEGLLKTGHSTFCYYAMSIAFEFLKYEFLVTYAHNAFL